jgi:osmotically-inducible protein OsmY
MHDPGHRIAVSVDALPHRRVERGKACGIGDASPIGDALPYRKGERERASVTLRCRPGWAVRSTRRPRTEPTRRQAATHAVQYSPGVGSVTNLIEVRPEAEPVGVGLAIRAALVRHADVEASRVTVTVDEWVVTLTGTVLTWSERRQIEDACWSAPGSRSSRTT